MIQNLIIMLRPSSPKISDKIVFRKYLVILRKPGHNIITVTQLFVRLFVWFSFCCTTRCIIEISTGCGLEYQNKKVKVQENSNAPTSKFKS